MGVAAFHEFGRKVDYEAFAEQHEEVQSDTVLRWGEWLSSEPYATRRIASLRKFMTTQAYVEPGRGSYASAREPPVLAAPGASRPSGLVPAGGGASRPGRSTSWSRAIITSFGGNVAPAIRDRQAGIVVAPGKVDVAVPGLPTVDIWAPKPRPEQPAPRKRRRQRRERLTRSSCRSPSFRGCRKP